MATRQSVVKVYSCFTEGMSGVLSEIEVSLTPGIPTFDVIGLCDSSIRESRGRIKAAIISTGFYMPKGHITVSISPAYMHKSGSSFDLAISLGILFVSNQLPFPVNKRIYAEGELSLNGELKSTPGSSIRLMANNNQFDYSFAPLDEINSAKCSGFNGMLVTNLKQVTDSFLMNVYNPYKYSVNDIVSEDNEYLDFSILRGQEKASRAILIAASGRHNLLLLGSSGCGKTLAGNLISGIMPELKGKEIGEVYMTREVTDSLSCDNNKIALSTKRPLVYISPDITSSKLLGIKSNPGELVLANHGVLFADEICEYKKEVIENLRIPLEDHFVRKIKDGNTFIYPASFVFVGAGNPCKCGYYYDDKHKCTCTPNERSRYLKKLSGPFLDRMDLFSEMRSISSSDMEESYYKQNLELSKRYREIVSRAWDIQKERYREIGDNLFNGTITNIDPELFNASKEVITYASDISSKEGFSGRGFNRILKVSRTIADMDGRSEISKNDIAEAVIYRQRVIK